MSEPTQEQLRTEAYWRSTIARELYDRADQMERESWNKATGIALASIVRDAGNNVGQMPDRTSAESASTVAAHAARARWAGTSDRQAAMAPARKAFDEQFERQVDPEGTLDAAERAELAASAKSAYFRALAAKATESRKTKRAAGGA